MLFQGECPQYRTVSPPSWRAKQVGQRAPWRGIVAFTHPRTGGAHDSYHRTAGIAGRTQWCVAARGARAAASEAPDNRVLGLEHALGHEPMDRCLCAAAA